MVCLVVESVFGWSVGSDVAQQTPLQSYVGGQVLRVWQLNTPQRQQHKPQVLGQRLRARTFLGFLGLSQTTRGTREGKLQLPWIHWQHGLLGAFSNHELGGGGGGGGGDQRRKDDNCN